ncbi:predicted protein, partial [Arabidopsis lyrata subsp. lyrata]
ETCNGIVPVLRVFNATASYVDQGGGKRKGIHLTINPFFFPFQEEHRARDLFYGLWIPYLFMERVQTDGQWSLFCSNEAPGLADCCGAEFEKLYTQYENVGKAKKVVQAQQQLWYEILTSQVKTGTPYMLFKVRNKAINKICIPLMSSNLCTEIVEYTSPAETAVCNLASIVLPRFCKGESRGQYLTTWFILLTKTYYHALKSSSEIATKEGAYETYQGSPGVVQPATWSVIPSDRWDWAALMDMISKNVIRNSLLVALMPTASTSQILGNNECFEPYTSNVFSRRVLCNKF